METNDPTLDAIRLVGERERCIITGVSRSTWRALEKKSQKSGERLVPERVQILPERTGWRLRDLIKWNESRPVYDGNLPGPTRRSEASAEAAAADHEGG